MRRLIAFFAQQGVFSDLLTVLVLFVGAYSALTIRREVFPNVQFDYITVTTIFPGASAAEVEKLVTNPLEQDFTELDGVKRMTSSSVENRSGIVIQLDPDQTTEEEAKADIMDIVDAFELPEGAEEPLVRALESKQNPVIEVALTSEKLSDLELREIAREVENEIEGIRQVAKVVPKGYEDLEFRVEADPKKLARYQLSLDDVIRALQAQNVTVPGGTIKAVIGPGNNPGLERAVRTIGEFKNTADIARTVIRASELGQSIQVKDIASVTRTMAERSQIYHVNGKPAVTLTVLTKEGADAIDLVDSVRALMARIGPQLKSRGVEDISFINDSSYFIRRRLGILTGNLAVGLVLVLIILSLVLPIRVAVIVGFGIPFGFLGTLLYFNAAGVSLNLISMIGLIIVLGMLVDDAVVVTENVVRRIEEGEEPTEAAINGAGQIWAPITASVMTTVVAFLPMMFMSGIMGKFIKYIPIGVVVALIISLLEAFFILPHHIARWVRRRPKNIDTSKLSPLRRVLHATNRAWDEKIVPAYARTLDKGLKHRYLVALGTFLLFVGSIVMAGTSMRFVLFPPEGIEIFFIRTESRIGVSLEQTARQIRPIEKLVAALPDEELDDFTTNVGIQAQDVNDPNTKRGPHYAQVTVYLTPETERERTAAEIIADLREKIGTPPGVQRVTFERVNPGPPVGKPISIGVRGREYEDQILPAVNWLKEKVSSWKGVSDVTDTYFPGKEEVIVTVKPDEAAAARLTAAQIGTSVRAAYEGIIATRVRGLDEEIDVRVMYPRAARTSEEALRTIQVPNPLGNLVPLPRVANFKTDRGIDAYEHESNRRQVRILGDVDNQNITATEVQSRVTELIPEIRQNFPGVTIHFGGEADDTAESMASLMRAFILAFMGVLLILVMQFKRLDQPFLVVLTIPMGIIAVIWTFVIHGMPLSFMGMLGVVALAGVIVNNAIVLMDFVNQYRLEGMDRWESIRKAAVTRLRPIFLTTLTTVAGLLPTAYGIGGLDPFVVPIALSLGWGLAFGSLLATFVFPVTMAILDDFTNFMRRRLKRPEIV